MRCEIKDCVPVPPAAIPAMRPENSLRWSNDSHWKSIGMNSPATNEIIQIPRGVWMVLDVDPPKLKRLYIYGALEVEDTSDRSIETEIFDLILHGTHQTEDRPMQDAPNCAWGGCWSQLGEDWCHCKYWGYHYTAGSDCYLGSRE